MDPERCRLAAAAAHQASDPAGFSLHLWHGCTLPADRRGESRLPLTSRGRPIRKPSTQER
jgi:hypothetical protein